MSADLVAHLVKRFPAGRESAGFMLDVSFQAAPGITVLYGASGAGKTLTLDCLAGFLAPDEGRILLDGKILFDRAARVHARPRDRQCGYVFQNYALFPHMTLRGNLEFAAERQPRLEKHRRVNELLSRFRIAELAGRFPHQVSGGQQQRCSIARALIGSPRFLLLDEPARGLDAELRENLYALLRELRAEYPIPILLVTHDLAEVFALADTLLVYLAGKIAQAGEPRALLERPASRQVASALGITNQFEAEILALDPGKGTSRIRAFEQELIGPYFPGHLLGSRLWLAVTGAALRVKQEPGPNRFRVNLLRVLERPASVRIEFTEGLSADMAFSEFRQMRAGQEWFVEVQQESLHAVGPG